VSANARIVWTLTIARAPLSVAFAAVLLSAGRAPAALWVGFGLLVLAELSDLLDGFLARRLGVASEWGAMLDPYADSVARVTVYWALAVAGLAMALTPLVMALRDVTVAYCRVVLIQRKRSVSANLSGKVKAVVQCFGAFLAVTGPLYWQFTGEWTVPVISWIVVVVTAASAAQYVRGALVAVREQPVPGMDR
jgi:CDP-diacylglycerol--glycerol-3-phosphate 3-phosphatidyltransferase